MLSPGPVRAYSRPPQVASLKSALSRSAADLAATNARLAWLAGPIISSRLEGLESAPGGAPSSV